MAALRFEKRFLASSGILHHRNGKRRQPELVSNLSISKAFGKHKFKITWFAGAIPSRGRRRRIPEKIIDIPTDLY